MIGPIRNTCHRGVVPLDVPVQRTTVVGHAHIMRDYPHAITGTLPTVAWPTGARITIAVPHSRHNNSQHRVIVGGPRGSVYLGNIG